MNLEHYTCLSRAKFARFAMNTIENYRTFRFDRFATRTRKAKDKKNILLEKKVSHKHKDGKINSRNLLFILTFAFVFTIDII